MKKIILILLLVVAGTNMAQNDETYVDNLVNEFTQKLENRGITTWYYTKRYCIGAIEMFKMEDGSMCISKGNYYEVYLVWQEDDSTMIKKIDNCGLYYSMPLTNSDLFNYVSENRAALRTEEVKPYEVANPENSPTQVAVVHPCRRYFKFKAGEDSFTKEFRLFDLTNESKQGNLNYKHNNALKIVELDRLLSALISTSGSTFRRQKQ